MPLNLTQEEKTNKYHKNQSSHFGFLAKLVRKINEFKEGSSQETGREPIFLLLKRRTLEKHLAEVLLAPKETCDLEEP